MKIYANEMPTKPKDCLFAHKEMISRIFDENKNSIAPIYAYICNINQRVCDLECEKQCNKLRVLMK